MHLATLRRMELEAERNGDSSSLLRYVEQSARSGEPDAQCYLGSVFHLGNGVSPNGPVADHWYQRAAASGYALAAHNLSVLHTTGAPGLAPDPKLAQYWASIAVKQGWHP